MRKSLNYIVLVLISYLLIELVSFSVYSIFNKSLFSFKHASQHQQEVIDKEKTVDINTDTVRVPWNVTIHPYFGFGKPAPSGFDFLENPADEVQNDPNGIIVGITGGSVSEKLFKGNREIIRKYIREIPVFNSRNIHIIQLGHFAWKQPQQLTALAYYFAMGGKLDILINIDGHNEVVDTRSNMLKKVNPAYPLVWLSLASNTITVHRMSLISAINNLETSKYRNAVFFSKSNFIVTMCVIWEFIDRHLASKISKQRILLESTDDSDVKGRPYYKYGPRHTFSSLDEMYNYFAQIWKNSSLQLYNLSKSNGATYFHFLQPNQYVPDSKIFSKKEMREYYKPENIGNGIRRGYPLLQNFAKDLKKEGVEFHDLTMIFKDNSETMYSDMVTHLNDRGRDILAYKVGQTILEYYKNKP